jgi:hypothetical protein
MLRQAQHDISNTNWLIKQHICSGCHAGSRSIHGKIHKQIPSIVRMTV